MFLIQGCSYTTHTTKLQSPIKREVVEVRYLSEISDRMSASIGDELFELNRYITGRDEVITVVSPTSKAFPSGAIWTGTHLYNDGTSGDVIVYTSPDYHKSEIGVLLNSDGYMVTDRPLVQLEGLKAGRSWRLSGKKFFHIPSKNIDSWALRYGGKNDGKHIFEIVKKHESRKNEILQSIFVTEQDFIDGFVIRKVLITGLESKKNGIIVYKIDDMLKKY